PEEPDLRTLERLLVDLVIDKAAAAIDTAGQRQTRAGAGVVAAVIKDDVHCAGPRIDRHPGGELGLAICLGVVVYAHRLLPRRAAVAGGAEEHVRIAVAPVDPVDVDRAAVLAAAEVHAGRRQAVAAPQPLDGEVPAARYLRNDLVLAERPAAVGRAREDQTL